LIIAWSPLVVVCTQMTLIIPWTLHTVLVHVGVVGSGKWEVASGKLLPIQRSNSSHHLRAVSLVALTVPPYFACAFNVPSFLIILSPLVSFPLKPLPSSTRPISPEQMSSAWGNVKPAHFGSVQRWRWIRDSGAIVRAFEQPQATMDLFNFLSRTSTED